MTIEFDSEVWLGDWLVPVTVIAREDDRLHIESVLSRGLHFEPPDVDQEINVPAGTQVLRCLDRVTVLRLEDEALLEYEAQAQQKRAETRGEL